MKHYTGEMLRVHPTEEERRRFGHLKAKALLKKHNQGKLKSIPFSYWADDYYLLVEFKEFGLLGEEEIKIIEHIEDFYKLKTPTIISKEKKLRNKTKILNSIEKISKKAGYTYKLGCYDENIEKVSLKELSRIVDALDYDASDVIVSIRRKLHVVEIFTVDNEIDLSIQNLDSYISQYGDNGILEKVAEYEEDKAKEKQLIQLCK